MLTRLLHLLTVLLGILGVAVCVGAAIVAWRTGARLIQANDKVFDRIDIILAAGRDRVLDVQKRVQESKITTQDVRQGVEDWARRQATERLASRPELDDKTERLALGLRQADLWLEMSGSSLQTVRQALEIATSLGASTDAAVVDPLLDRLGGLRQRLKESTDTVDAIRQRIDEAAAGETLEERLTRLAQLSLRVIATLSEIDSRLGEFADGFVAAQARGQQLKDRTHRFIVTAEIVALLLIGWMAAGQVFLSRHGWTLYQRRGRTT